MANLTEIVAALNLPLGDLTFEDDILIGTQRGDRIVRPLEAGEFAFGTLAPDILPVNLSLVRLWPIMRRSRAHGRCRRGVWAGVLSARMCAGT